jgi:transcriptional antiterminator RfaH
VEADQLPTAPIWGVVRTMVAQEDCARLHCARQGYETFLPKFKTYVVARGTRKPVVRSLFPGYLFVRITDGIWYSLTGTRGVLSVLRDGDFPARVRDAEIEYLMQRFGESGTKELHSSRFEPGQQVRAITGLWRDNVGTFEGLAPGDRVKVLFEMMGRATRVEIGERELAAA